MGHPQGLFLHKMRLIKSCKYGLQCSDKLEPTEGRGKLEVLDSLEKSDLRE